MDHIFKIVFFKISHYLCRHKIARSQTTIIVKEMIEKIGINAGKLWIVLDESGRQNMKEIKKVTKLTDKDLYTALGWLAREGKITLEEVEKELFISLS